MKPMDRQYIEQHDITRRYLNGKLTPEETEAFEVYLLENPEELAALETDAILAAHIQSAISTANRDERPGWQSWFSFKPLVSAAVAFAVGLVVIPLIMPVDGPKESIPSSADIRYLSPVRSSLEPSWEQIALSDVADNLVLVIQPDLTDGTEEFDVTVSMNDRELFDKPLRLHTNQDGDVVLILPANRLEPGQLILTNSSKEAGTEPQKISIKLLKE